MQQQVNNEEFLNSFANSFHIKIVNLLSDTLISATLLLTQEESEMFDAHKYNLANIFSVNYNIYITYNSSNKTLTIEKKDYHKIYDTIVLEILAAIAKLKKYSSYSCSSYIDVYNLNNNKHKNSILKNLVVYKTLFNKAGYTLEYDKNDLFLMLLKREIQLI